MKLYKLLFIPFLFLPALLFSQVSDEAQMLYEEGDYSKAKILLEKELEENPSDATISYLLGISSMHIGDVENAEQMLLSAKKKKINDATLYLGRLYAIQYKFDEAEKEFAAYEKAMRRNSDALAELEKQREYSDRLQRMVSRTEDIQIIDSVVVRKDNFLSVYNLSLEGGSLQWARDFFDDSSNEDGVVYMNERKTKVYYSRFATDQGETLYTMEKLIDNFGNEKIIPSPITDRSDQSFPFIMSDGLTIYFATKGHESIGGYDLYASRYNLNTNTYLSPNQMNMPFNSPFNDYMMVIDEQKGVGWFASDRYQDEDQVCIYTFIPNDEVRLIQSDDIDYLAQRAKISVIQDSWRQDINYSSLIDKASSIGVSDEVKSFDFEFVINDDNTYHQISDFKSFSARELFVRAQDVQKELRELENKLDEMRQQYAQASADKESQLGQEILFTEKRVSELFDQLTITKVMARNEEIRHINVLN